ncbi:c-type cytochrome [bacterium]|nr:c-type cytochrome [bacterium]MBU1991334.1 c-type cytochrome [bacterium]
MKNILVGFLTIFILALMVWVASSGKAYHGGEHAKVIEDFGDKDAQQTKASTLVEKDDRNKEMDKLGALRDKAGNAGAFKVSQAYKSKCASCHGVNGSGFQNGKQMMGPKLFGQSAEEIYKSLIDFKAGRKENLIMKGLLIKLDDADLKMFADEIGDFPRRAQETANE